MSGKISVETGAYWEVRQNGEGAAASMSIHRFKVGDAVSVHGPANFSGPCRITRLLPVSDNGEPQYRVTNVADGHDWVLREPAMRLLPVAANLNKAADALGVRP